MKMLVTIMIALAAIWCKGMPSTNTFVAVTNDWYNANFTNVYELVGGKFSLTVQATNAPAANTAFSIRGNATGTWTLHKNTNDYVTVVMTNVIHRTTEY